jgi:hypothetical protein
MVIPGESDMLLNQAEMARRNWLKWVLDFCNVDLGSVLYEWEKHYLVYTLDKVFYPRGDPEDIRQRLFGDHFDQPSPYAYPKITNEIWERVLSIQGKLKSFIDGIIATREKEIDERNISPLFWGISPKRAEFAPVLSLFVDGSCQSGYIPVIPALIAKHHVFRYMFSHFSGKGEPPSPIISSSEEGAERDETQENPSQLSDPTISGIKNGGDQDEDKENPCESFDPTMTADDFSFEVLDGENSDELPYYYLGWLFGLLDGASTQWIQKCKGCSRFFLNPTKREKMYCSSSCASRSIVKTERQKIKEKYPKKYGAYLEKQRELMRNQYEKKKKARLGPDATVKRRPRKRTI